MIETLLGKQITHIASGGSHSAAITSTGELYTWGKGRYGRLGKLSDIDRVLRVFVGSKQHFAGAVFWGLFLPLRGIESSLSKKLC